MRPVRSERRAMARDMANILETCPPEFLLAVGELLGGMLHGNAALVLVVGGEVGRISMLRASGDGVSRLVGEFDASFRKDVPIIDLRDGGADAKSTH